jgi:hypothetical protein
MLDTTHPAKLLSGHPHCQWVALSRRPESEERRKLWQRARLRLQAPGGPTEHMTVSEYTKGAMMMVVDLKEMIPKLR